MQRVSLLSPPLFVTVLTIGLVIAAHAPSAAAVSTRLLTDPQGENDGDIFGCSVASAGDVNADGYDDVVIGANFYPAESGEGRAYVFFGGPVMHVVADLVIPSPSSTTRWFGISVAGAGDFNGDGYSDFIVGARYAGPGKAFIYYGGPSLDATPDLTLTGEQPTSGSWFGNSVAPIGDVNGDGFDDVIVGAPAYGSAPSAVGRAYVFYGGNVPDALPDRVFTGINAGDRLGWAVGSAGDMNGDGHPDVFATAPRYYASGTDPGSAYVWFGGPGFDTVADLTIHGSVLADRVTSAANAGDVDVDGFSDLVITRQGRAEVYFGGSSPNAIPDLTITGGFGSAAGGDMNGDGVDDIVLGASVDNTGGTDAGRVSIYFGGGAVDAIEDVHFVGDGPNRRFGRGVATARRVDGPGPADLIVAAAQLDPEELGYDTGRVYVYANSFETTAVPLTVVSGLEFANLTPNPASADVSLTLTLDHSVAVRITVYDVAGHEVARPVADEWLVGRVTRTWQPRGLPSGIYYVSARLGDRQQVRKLVWLGPRP